MEARPGEEVQVDFGLGASIDDGASRSRRSWVFRMVLSYSRKAYSEAVLRQDTETFLRCLENGLRAFGGVPLLLNLDNLKAAVLKADWFDPAREVSGESHQFCTLGVGHRSEATKVRQTRVPALEDLVSIHPIESWSSNVPWYTSLASATFAFSYASCAAASERSLSFQSAS
jgi:Integrase core domain